MARSHAPTPFPRRFAVRDRGGRPGLASNQSSDCLPDDCLLVSQLRDSAGLRVRRTRHRLPPLRPRASGQRGTTVTSIGFEQQYNIRGMDCQTFTQAAMGSWCSPGQAQGPNAIAPYATIRQVAWVWSGCPPVGPTLTGEPLCAIRYYAVASLPTEYVSSAVAPVGPDTRA